MASLCQTYWVAFNTRVTVSVTAEKNLYYHVRISVVPTVAVHWPVAIA